MTVAVARLGRASRRQWVGGAQLEAVWAPPAPRDLDRDLADFPAELHESFARSFLA